MKISVVDQSPIFSNSSANKAIQETRELARYCDSLGLTRFWLAEHHGSTSFAGCSPDRSGSGLAVPAPSGPASTEVATAEIDWVNANTLFPEAPTYPLKAILFVENYHNNEIYIADLGEVENGPGAYYHDGEYQLPRELAQQTHSKAVEWLRERGWFFGNRPSSQPGR